MSELERVVARIDELRDEAVALLQELVATVSVNPNYPGVDRAEFVGGETRCNDVLQERYAAAGLETHRVAADPERSNLVGVRPGAGGGRSLILNGHVDTVPPAEADRWTCGSPWNPELRDGILFGLGSTDMKGSAVSMWLTAQALHDTGIELAGDLQLHSVVGEETGEYQLGTIACVEAGFRADGAVVTEPTGAANRARLEIAAEPRVQAEPDSARAPRPLTIATHSAGFLWFRVLLEGRSTHAGNRPLAIRPGGPGDAIGVNALEKGVLVVEALQELERQWGLTKTHPCFSPGFFTIMPGIFHADPGMPFPAYFPNRAELHWLAWYPPQESDEAVANEIEAYLRTACRLDPWLREHPPVFEVLMRYPGMQTDWEHPLPQAMARAFEAVTGEAAEQPTPQHPSNFGAAMEGTWLEQAGIPSICFGPGDLTVAHARDEHVRIDEVVTAGKALAACAIEWCGTPG